MTKQSDGYLFAMDAIGLKSFVSNLEGLRNIIEGLRGGMKYHYDYSGIRTHVIGMMDAWCGEGECYRSYRLPHPLTVVRARKLRLPEEMPLHIADLGSPDAVKTIGYGRCHIPKQPMCYCALYEETALAEVDAQLGEELVITTYGLWEDLKVFPVGEIDFFRRTGETYLGSAIQGTCDHYRNMQQGANWNGISLLDAFFAEEFIDRASSQADYRVTSAFCDILRNVYGSQGRLEAIMYPSVAFRAGFNFAVTPEAEKAKLTVLPSETRVIRIIDVLGYGMYRREVLLSLEGVAEDGSLEWEKSRPEKA